MKLNKKQIETMSNAVALRKFWGNQLFTKGQMNELITGYHAYIVELEHHHEQQKLLRMELQSLGNHHGAAQDQIRTQLGWHNIRLATLKGGE